MPISHGINDLNLFAFTNFISTNSVLWEADIRWFHSVFQCLPHSHINSQDYTDVMLAAFLFHSVIALLLVSPDVSWPFLNVCFGIRWLDLLEKYHKIATRITDLFTSYLFIYCPSHPSAAHRNLPLRLFTWSHPSVVIRVHSSKTFKSSVHLMTHIFI